MSASFSRFSDEDVGQMCRANKDFSPESGLGVIVREAATESHYHPTFTRQVLLLSSNLEKGKAFLVGMSHKEVFGLEWTTKGDDARWARRLTYYESSSPSV
jgi:hypothetical protein